MTAYRELLGYVVGIKYNSEGIIIDWLYGQKGLTNYCEKPKIFKTEKSAQRFIDKNEHMGIPYHRPYYFYHDK